MKTASVSPNVFCLTSEIESQVVERKLKFKEVYSAAEFPQGKEAMKKKKEKKKSKKMRKRGRRADTAATEDPPQQQRRDFTAHFRQCCGKAPS